MAVGMMHRLTAALLLGLVLLAPGQVAAQTAQTSQKDDDRDRGWLRWRNRPSFQFGELRLDLRLKLQYDWRRFDDAIEDEETSIFRVRRGGVNGEIGNHVEFQIERDLNEDGKWRDVFVNWRTFRQAEVMVGRFKVPFGREQNVGIMDVDFAYRTLVSSTIPPARDKGVMVRGRFLRRGITYEVGGFDGDGDNGSLEEPQFSVSGDPDGLSHSVAARVTALPLRPLSDTFDTFRLGAAYGAVDVPEGLNSLRGRSIDGVDFFDPVYVNGRRQRYGAELTYTPGPVGFAGEWMQAREERKGQGLRNNDLSDVAHDRVVRQRHVAPHRRRQGRLQQPAQFAVHRRHRRDRGRRALRVPAVRKRREDRAGVRQPACGEHPAEWQRDLDLRRQLVSQPLGSRAHQRDPRSSTWIPTARRSSEKPTTGSGVARLQVVF